MKIYKGLIFTILIIAFGCSEDVLDKQPLDIISEDVVWQDPVLIDVYLNGIYTEMPFLYSIPASGNTFGTQATISEEMEVSDECGMGRILANPNWKLGNLKVEGGMLEFWGYSTVRKLNDFIERVTVAPIEEALITQRLAEARFLRAFAYFEMVKRYGGVPLITKVQNIDDSEEELYRKRDNEEEIYDFILSEVDDIVNDLPETYSSSDYGRPTKYAALALKSRAAMYAASIAQWGQVELDGVVGIPANKAEELWLASYNASMEIIASGKYSLYNKYPEDKIKNYQEIFLDERNNETIFSKQYTGLGSLAHYWDWAEAPATDHSIDFGQQSYCYLEMVEDYENIDGTSGKIDRDLLNTKLWTIEELYGNKDPRLQASIYTQNTSWKGRTLQMYSGIITESGEIIRSGYYNGISAVGYDRMTDAVHKSFGIKKYLDPTLEVVQGNDSKTDFIVFRYAEILLNFAEAAFELGKQDEALNAVNQIRSRAGIAELSSIDRDAIRHERKIELAFERHRYWDLRRWRIAENALTRDFSSIAYYLDYTTRKFKVDVIENVEGTSEVPVFFEKNYYFPITPERISNNPNLVENPGY